MRKIWGVLPEVIRQGPPGKAPVAGRKPVPVAADKREAEVLEAEALDSKEHGAGCTDTVLWNFKAITELN